MDIPILIEPIEDGRFRARAGEPFGVCADGQTESEAAQRLATLLQDRLKAGARLAVIAVGNGPQKPLHLDPLPDDDWFFQALREEIAENRRREDEAHP